VEVKRTERRRWNADTGSGRQQGAIGVKWGSATGCSGVVRRAAAIRKADLLLCSEFRVRLSRDTHGVRLLEASFNWVTSVNEKIRSAGYYPQRSALFINTVRGHKNM
jgi:hypothetical protein